MHICMYVCMYVCFFFSPEVGCTKAQWPVQHGTDGLRYLAVAQKKSTWISGSQVRSASSSASSLLPISASSGGGDAVNLSFLGTGGDRVSGPCGALARGSGCGWVSWPVCWPASPGVWAVAELCVASGAECSAWLGGLAWLKNCARVGEVGL